MILFSLLLMSAYSFACLSLGLVLLRCFVGRETLQADHAPSARVAGGFLLGGGVLANLWLCVSLIPGGWFTLPVVGGLLLLAASVGAIPAARALSAVVRQFAQSLRNLRQSHWLWAILAVATLVFPLLYALAAALPPRGDAVAFYFALPKLLAFEGALRPLPGIEFFSQNGLHGELHTATLMLLGSAQAATLFAGFIGVATAMMLIEIARRAGIGREGRWTVLLLTYTSTAFTYLTFAGRLDLFGVALSLAAIYWALSKPLRPGVLLLVGVLGCFGVIAKATYALTTVPMLVVLLSWRSVVSAENHRIQAVVRAWGWCLAGALIAVAPHVIKNVVLHGPDCALTPFLSSPGGHDWAGSEIRTDPQQVCHVLCTYPVAIFLGQFSGMYGLMTVAALALWPLVLLLPRPKRFINSTLAPLSVVGVLGVAIFALLQTSNFSLRYFLPPLLLLLLAPAAAVDFVWNDPRTRNALKIGVAVVLVLALAERFNRPKGHPGEGLKYILAQAGALEVSEASARMCDVINTHADSADRVYLATFYPYFLRPELIATASGHPEREAITAIATPEGRWRNVYEKGFRFIGIGPQGGALYSRDQSFTLGPKFGCLESKTLPADLELICHYWGPGETKPNGYAVFELRQTRP